jgi:FtsZ-binding cell division protein ZapB
MDEHVIIERIRKLRQEISEIKAANRIYWECHQHTQAEKNNHERRRERLQEIKSELPILWEQKARF